MTTPTVALVASRVRVEEKRLIQVLQRRACPFTHVDDRMLTHRFGNNPPPWDLVLNRSMSAARRIQVSRLCEFWSIPVVNDCFTVSTCDDKIATTLALHKHGLPVPETAVALSPMVGPGIAEQLGYPAVLKPVNGSWGRQVCRLGDRDAIEAVLELRGALPSSQQHLVYLQEFVHTPQRDIRVIVAGERVIAAGFRYSDHWVTNAARGAKASPCPLTSELESLSLRASSAVGGGILGVDLLEAPDGRILLNEVNSAVEFHSLEQATGTDVAEGLIDYLLGECGA